MRQTEARRIAAVDIGSNTFHLIIAEAQPESADFTILERQVELVRLGEDVAATGGVGPERMAKGVAVLRAMVAKAQVAGVQARLALATEGVRMAANAAELIDQFSVAWGEPIALISGMEEAALTYWGATSAWPATGERIAVADLGGGSCELVTGIGPEIVAARSLPLGSGRLIDAVKPSDPPTEADHARLSQMAEAVLQQSGRFPEPIPIILGVGGTATALGRLTQQSQGIAPADVTRAWHILADHTVAELAQTTGIDTGRLRLLVGGVVAWQAILAHTGAQRMLPSERGVREGAVVAWLHARDAWVEYARKATPAQ